MGCTTLQFPEGTRGIVCDRRRKPRCSCKCGRVATRECDWKVKSRESGTCDAKLCDSCSFSPAPEKDLCPAHRIAYEQWKKRLEALAT